MRLRPVRFRSSPLRRRHGDRGAARSPGMREGSVRPRVTARHRSIRCRPTAGRWPLDQLSRFESSHLNRASVAKRQGTRLQSAQRGFDSRPMLDSSADECSRGPTARTALFQGASTGSIPVASTTLPPMASLCSWKVRSAWCRHRSRKPGGAKASGFDSCTFRCWKIDLAVARAPFAKRMDLSPGCGSTPPSSAIDRSSYLTV